MPLWAAVVLAACLVGGGHFALKENGTRRIARYEKRLAERLAAGKDRYFEELRELQAYDPRRRSKRYHVIVEALELVAAFVVLVQLFTKTYW